MWQFVESKALLLVLVWLFCGGIIYIGLHEVSFLGPHHRRVVADQSLYPEDDEMISVLHGDVNLGRRSLQRRRSREEGVRERDQNWDSVKRFMGSLVP
jgi:hypothetical protein